MPEVLRRTQPVFLRRVQRPAALRRARSPRSDAPRLAQEAALKADEAFEALALMF